MDAQRLERLDMLVALAEEHLAFMRGTVYEHYAEHLLEEVLSERQEYLSSVTHAN